MKCLKEYQTNGSWLHDLPVYRKPVVSCLLHAQSLTKPFISVEFIIISVSADNFCLSYVKLGKAVIQ